jgi:hypothetical protein
MIRLSMFAVLFSLASAVAGRAAEDAPKYAGYWTKDNDGITMNIHFKKEKELDFKVEMGDNSLTMRCSYTVEKDGLIKAKLVKKTIKGEFPFEPKDGFTFQFKLKIEKDKATLSDFDASENAENAKGAVEGKYSKKEEK